MKLLINVWFWRAIMVIAFIFAMAYATDLIRVGEFLAGMVWMFGIWAINTIQRVRNEESRDG